MASLEGLYSIGSLLHEKLEASQEGETLLVCVNYMFDYAVVILGA